MNKLSPTGHMFVFLVIGLLVGSSFAGDQTFWTVAAVVVLFCLGNFAAYKTTHNPATKRVLRRNFFND